MPTKVRTLMPTDELQSHQHPSVKLWMLVQKFKIILSSVSIQMTFLISFGRMADVLMKQDFKERCGKQTLITGFFQCESVIHVTCKYDGPVEV